MRMSPFVLVLVTMAAPALANDRLGYTQITAGDLQGAETTLTAERRIFPRRPELMLNLAAVYRQTGRADAARDLYAQVLALPEVSLLMPSGAALSSHAVAQRGLEKLSPAVLATR